MLLPAEYNGAWASWAVRAKGHARYQEQDVRLIPGPDHW